MQITHEGKTYKWIGKYWGEKDITDVGKISVTYGEVGFTDQYQGVLRTYHTPEQLVKLGYMVNITDCDHDWDICMRKCRICRATRQEIYMEETKPEEKQTWYIHKGTMKDSEYWDVFKKWFIPDRDLFYLSEFYGKKEGRFIATDDIEGEYQYLFSPYQWYKNIYKPDHDKAMEIPENRIHEVPKYNPRAEDSSYDSATFDDSEIQLEMLTNSLNLVIKKINNL